MKTPGNVDDDDAVVALEEEFGAEPPPAKVVEQKLVPVRFDQFRDNDGNDAIRFLLGCLVYEVEDGLLDAAIGRMKDGETGFRP